jgi:hypothetical protein
MGCGQCGMLVEPPTAFHPYLYCRLFGLGVLDPAAFLERQHFIDEREIFGCHCGFEADESDCGDGDSVVEHLRSLPQEATP